MEFTIPQMWAKMGFIAKGVVIILGVMSVFVVAIAIERLIVFMKARKQSREYALMLQDLLQKDKFKEAAEAAQNYKFSHVAKVVRAALQEFMKGNLLAQSCAEYDVLGGVNRSIEKAAARELAYLRRGLAGLATVGSTAPFVGLFGTVFGIINSFQGMAAEGSGGLGAVSAGIAEALVTTGAGIGVAIVAVLLYNYFTSQVEVLQVDTSESALEILDLLHKRQQGASKAA
jgi:biopolymer transport protein ExbB